MVDVAARPQPHGRSKLRARETRSNTRTYVGSIIDNNADNAEEKPKKKEPCGLVMSDKGFRQGGKGKDRGNFYGYGQWWPQQQQWPPQQQWGQQQQIRRPLGCARSPRPWATPKFLS